VVVVLVLIVSPDGDGDVCPGRRTGAIQRQTKKEKECAVFDSFESSISSGSSRAQLSTLWLLHGQNSIILCVHPPNPEPWRTS
jgi:hypothetical protein